MAFSSLCCAQLCMNPIRGLTSTPKPYKCLQIITRQDKTFSPVHPHRPQSTSDTFLRQSRWLPEVVETACSPTRGWLWNNHGISNIQRCCGSGPKSTKCTLSLTTSVFIFILSQLHLLDKTYLLLLTIVTIKKLMVQCSHKHTLKPAWK